MGNGTDQNNRSGFTLIEILIVLAITALLSSLAIVYTHVGQNQISLSIEESKVAQLILEAKELSIATYSTNSATCAYGVHFDYASSTYSLFEYNSAASSSVPGGRPLCPSLTDTLGAINFDALAIQPYQSGSWQVHTAQGVKLYDGGYASGTIQDVLFYPPDPFTAINLSGQSDFTAAPTASYVYLRTTDGSAARTITINPVGQVSL
jgi:prepilin-type N-terminal cleavage/methylation domain-containing protein